MPHTCQVGDRVRSVRGLSHGLTSYSDLARMGAEEKIVLCHAGLIKLASFAKHLKFLRGHKARGYDIDGLVPIR